jgi:hypothetical protein
VEGASCRNLFFMPEKSVMFSILADQALPEVVFQEKSVFLSISKIAIVTDRMTGPMKI